MFVKDLKVEVPLKRCDSLFHGRNSAFVVLSDELINTQRAGASRKGAIHGVVQADVVDYIPARFSFTPES